MWVYIIFRSMRVPEVNYVVSTALFAVLTMLTAIHTNGIHQNLKWIKTTYKAVFHGVDTIPQMIYIKYVRNTSSHKIPHFPALEKSCL
jgi:hypothetical protein